MARGQPEEPTRLFSGFMLAEDTNERFHYLTQHQRTHRLSTAFDGPTLYGIDSDADGVFGKIGEGGVAIDTVEDMVRLYDGFDLGSPNFSASMTISGPAPIIMAMYIAAAKRRFGQKLSEICAAQSRPTSSKKSRRRTKRFSRSEASLRFLTDMVEFTTREMPRWYPISISGYHIGEAGSTPVQQAAYTLSNGFAYAEMFAERGIPIDQFGPRLSFFLDCGLDVEYIALARVSRRIWAIGMRDAFGAGPRGQLFKLHTQTSGRSLIAAEFKNNLTRTAAELMLAYMNATNSCHSNSADEPFTTPSEEWIRLAAHGQAILLEESGIFKHTMNMLSGSPGMKAVERAVESSDPGRVSRDRATGRSAGGGGRSLPAQSDSKRRASLRGANLRRHSSDHWLEQISQRRGTRTRNKAGSYTTHETAAPSRSAGEIQKEEC